MDLTQLANLGEFIGGLAVLVTLVYLAVQVRQNTATQKAATEIASADATYKIVDAYSRFRHMLADQGMAEIWAKAPSGQALSAAERVQLRAVVSEVAYASVAALPNYLLRGSDAAVPHEVVARVVGNSKTLRSVWAEISAELRAYNLGEFADEVERRLGAGERTG